MGVEGGRGGGIRIGITRSIVRVIGVCIGCGNQALLHIALEVLRHFESVGAIQILEIASKCSSSASDVFKSKSTMQSWSA